DDCDSTGCASSPVQTDNVSALLGIGDRPGATTIPFTIDDTINATVDVGSGWRLSTGSDVYLNNEPASGAVTYHGPNGTTGVFTPAGSGSYASPAGFTMDLAATPGGWTLWDHDSGQTS